MSFLLRSQNGICHWRAKRHFIPLLMLLWCEVQRTERRMHSSHICVPSNPLPYLQGIAGATGRKKAGGMGHGCACKLGESHSGALGGFRCITFNGQHAVLKNKQAQFGWLHVGPDTNNTATSNLGEGCCLQFHLFISTAEIGVKQIVWNPQSKWEKTRGRFILRPSSFVSSPFNNTDNLGVKHVTP